MTEVSRRPITAGALFKTSMHELIENLKRKVPFYIRCIKPNAEKSPSKFDEQIVDHQVEYLGLVENVRVRRAGFAYRADYDRFLKRYKMISGKTWPNYYGGGGNQMACREIINEKSFNGDSKYGKTKIFIRSPQTIVKLEQEREHYLGLIIILLQKVVYSHDPDFVLIAVSAGMARYNSANALQEDSRSHVYCSMLPTVQTARVLTAIARYWRRDSSSVSAQPANHGTATCQSGELATATQDTCLRGNHHSTCAPTLEGLASPSTHSKGDMARVSP